MLLLSAIMERCYGVPLLNAVFYAIFECLFLVPLLTDLLSLAFGGHHIQIVRLEFFISVAT